MVQVSNPALEQHAERPVEFKHCIYLAYIGCLIQRVITK